MKKHSLVLAAAILALGFAPAHSLFGQMPGNPQFGDGLEKLFGDNQAFSATLEVQNQMNSGDTMTVTGKLAFDKGDSRFEINLSDMKGGKMPPNAAAQMKSMGLDHMVSISQSDRKTVYVIYPNVQSYVEMTSDSAAAGTNKEPAVETTKLGEETVDGHPCVKNKTVVTDRQGDKHDFTVWNATDLKNFPVKIEMNEQGNAITMSYRDISFSKPGASLFTPPTGYTKYDTMQEMMQSVMMKKMGAGIPPRQ